MQRVISAVLIVLLARVAVAQEKPISRTSIRIVAEGRTSMVRLAPRFTTTVRLPEAVSSVIVGDPSLFHAEHSPSEPLLVFVKPATPAGAHTNLLITTVGGRQFPLLLQSDGDAGKTGSVPDLLVVGRTAGTSFIEETYSTSVIAETLALGSSPVNEGSVKPAATEGDSLIELVQRQRSRPSPRLQGERLQVGIGEVVERDSRFVVLFSVLNSTDEPVELMPPQVQLAGQVKAGLFKQSSRWTTVEQIPVVDFRLDKRKLNAGARTDGLVVFERPALKQSNESLLLQIAEAAMVDQPVLVPIRFSVSDKLEENRE